MKETIFYVFLASSVIFDARNKNEWIFNTWSMYSKTCPIPVKNVRDKLIETTPLSSLLSDWYTYNN